MLCTVFYKEDDDTTVVADGFPVLNALREVHLLLTQGAHNQYGDLPWTARQECLMQQWILARPEMREFLPRRIMVDYPEAVDGLGGDHEDPARLDRHVDPALPGHGDLRGEDPAVGPVRRVDRRRSTRRTPPTGPGTGARRSRATSIAYRAATGVDLAAATVTGQVNATIPSVLLRKRLPKQVQPMAPAPPRRSGGPRVGGRAARRAPSAAARRRPCAKAATAAPGPAPAPRTAT